jgi:pyruvate/2-oxoglutarate dehydrogenase complex dihydrolipoamide dehydrogenase (E3) component
MTEILRPDLCVIGGGPGGLAAARTAASLGAKVVLVEKRLLGGNDHLRSAWQAQLLAAAATRSMLLRSGPKTDLLDAEALVDFKRLRADADAAIERFARDDSPARLRGLGIRLIQTSGSFISRSRFEADATIIEARKFLLAVGSFTTAPAIAGSEFVRPLTPDRIAELTLVPKRLAVIGASPQNLMLAQAFQRLGSQVVLLPSQGLLADIDPELTMPLFNGLRKEGMEILAPAAIRSIELMGSGPQGSTLKLVLADATSIEATHLLYSGERVALVESLGLKAARVVYDKDGVRRDARSRSSNRKIYAIDDDFDSFHNLRAARRTGERLAEQLFSRNPPEARPMAKIIPTDPELAIIGLSETEARARHKAIRVARAGFSENLRAQTLAQPIRYPNAGHVKIIANGRGHVVGAGVVGPQARELIGLFSLALAHRLKLEDLTALEATQPTLMEICRTATLASASQTGKVSVWRRLFAFRATQ